MGETHSKKQETSYPTTLNLVEATDDKNFGAIEIYRTKQAPYDYVMDFKKTFIQDNDRTNKYLRLMNELKHMDHKNLAKIHHCQLTEQTNVCIKHKKLHTYCNYYNFTLEEAIKKKKLQDGYFPESQLVYIMGCLLDVAQYLQKYGVSIGEYRSQSIFLSPEGFVKLFLLQMQEQNKHSCYYKALSDRTLLSDFIFAPEQLHYLNNLEYQLKYDVFKADLFAIGMVILELITLDKSRYYYNEEKTELKIQRICFDVARMGKNYSPAFVNLLKGCLQPDAAYRLSLELANQELAAVRKGLKSMTYCIRLQEDEERAKKKGVRREITMSAKGQHILDGLQKKLTPSPIATLSTSVSSQYQIESNRNSGRTSATNSIKF